MKRFFVFVLCLFTGVVYAHTINWYVDDQLYQTTTCTIGDDVTPPTAPTKYGYTLRWYPNFTKIEYLESTGTQRLATGFNPNQNTSIRIEYYNDANTSGTLCGTTTANNTPSAGSPAYTCGADYGASRATIHFNASNHRNKKIVYYRNKNEAFYYDEQGNTIGTVSNKYITFQMGRQLFLLVNSRDESTLQSPFCGKIYSIKIWDNDTLVRDMVPVLDLNGVPCMYDLITNRFFYNIGSGNFIAGPVLS